MHAKHLFVSFSALVAGFFSSSGFAQPSSATLTYKLEQQFEAADKNGDGALTKAEAEAAGMSRVVRHFDRIDGNKDGKITPDELRAVVRARLAG
jgi:Ca2+-binding EF-hand superfamily protein